MVAKAGGYGVTILKYYRVLTEDEPLCPAISNVLVDAVIRNWIRIVAV